jgi:nicotinate-nucleotide--dimethylbenzimidazole phosphoribosyltransferase
MRQDLDQGGGSASKERAGNAFACFDLARGVTGKEQVGQPQGQTIDQQANARCRVPAQGSGQIDGLLDQPPVSAAPLPMVRDALRHFAVERLRRRQVDHLQATLAGPALGQDTLARTGSTNDQFSHPAKISMPGGGYNRPFAGARQTMHFSIPPTIPLPALQARIDGKTKPPGSLGQLERLAQQIGQLQQSLTPSLGQPQLLVFAGDHGAARAGVSAYPQEVTWQMVENFLAGGAAINVFARHNGLQLQVIDAGVAHDFGARDGLVDAKIGFGTNNFIEQAAMSEDDCQAAIARGAAIARQLADDGCQVIGFGEMGIGNTAAAALLTHQLTGTPLADCVGRGTGLDDAGLARKQALLARAAARAALAPGAPALSVLAEFGGFEIAMMAGAMLAAAERACSC